MQFFFNKIEEIHPLTEGSRESLKSICYKQIFSKSDCVLKHNEICKGIYFVERGMLRIFYYKQGREITEWFAPEQNFCFSINSFFTNTPSQLIIQCLEESEIVVITKNGLSDLITSDIEISNFYTKLLSGSLICSQVRMDSILFETAAQRYQNLITTTPTIPQRVPLQYIASYLGVSPETLSRIRSRVN